MSIHGRRAPHTSVVVVIFVAFFIVEHPRAYVDPGSASYVVQILAGGVLGGLFVLRSYWPRVKASVSRVVRFGRVD